MKRARALFRFFHRFSPTRHGGGARISLFLALLTKTAWADTSAALVVTNQSPDFDRIIRPILSENCYKCHGPDDGARKSNLRLDRRTEATQPAKTGATAIVPGSPELSEMIRRISSTSPEKRMPPPSTGKKLTQSHVNSLRQWIAGGAAYTEHWSYIKPVRPSAPVTNDKSWAHNPIDQFILARLEREGLKPSATADRITLIRRASLDLTGLPPTPKEVDDFVNDAKPDAYERLVDQLLERKSFGEHWARMWLDLARYADSAGYADDPARTIWEYRDYVIRSFNENKPFDQFTIEQIGGDLLPEPTEEQRIATAFHRNTMTNNEGGTDDEEFRNAAVVDRVNTTMAVWMGTSMACAQCHHHKYDPFSQEEYFRLFAILNNTEDSDRSDEAPVKRLYTPDQLDRLARARKEAWDLDEKFQLPTPESTAQQARWELQFPKEIAWQYALDRLQRPITPQEEQVDHQPLSLDIVRLIVVPAADRSETQALILRRWYRQHLAPELKQEQARYASLEKEIDDIKPNTVPMMKELEEERRRQTHIQLRGNFLALGEEVTPAVPAIFHPLRTNAPPNRLALARWLVDADNPLTAGVTANRLWEQVFGIGIVRTSEDFGSQGEMPTHPELLDWLATEFVSSGWNVKALLKLMVTSATYCQCSRVTPELRERDPDNVLLARGPRFRMTAEEVRDQALFVSDLLSPKMFGAPVRPPQPSSGLSAAFGSSLDWKPSEGEDRYRRALYIEWRRTNPYPSLATFDAPNREVCALRRPRSNTPLQALVTLNDPVYVEAAQGLGRRMAQADGSIATKVSLGFRLCLSRLPNEHELQGLVGFYQAALDRYRAQPDEAEHMALEPIGLPLEGSDFCVLAAWSTLGNVLLNLDETFMRP